MYHSTSAFNVSDLASDKSRLRASASTSNVPWTGEQPFSWNGTTQPQYVPGYLLSSTQGSPLAASNSSYVAPLIPEPFKRGPSSNAQFGADPLHSTSKQAPGSRASVLISDDSDAPPANSLMDGIVSTPESKSHFRNSVTGGFHTASIAPSPIQPFVHSQSTSGSNVVVFGFPRDKYEEIVGVFVAMGDSSVIESPVACNWVTISYKNSWEAARAIRRNGEIIGGTTMIGVKWADPSQSEAAPVPTSPQSGAASFSIGKPVTYASSGSAFKQQDTGGRARGATWGVQDGSSGKQDQGGVVSRLTDIVFGW